MNNGIFKYALLLAFVALAACTSKVTPSGGPVTSKPYFATAPESEKVIVRKVGRVQVELSEAVRKKFARNYRFSRGELFATVRRALKANELMANEPAGDLPIVRITVTDARIRSHFNAVMFGFMAGADRIAGDVAVVSANGEELQRFIVDTSYALGGTAGGEDSFRTGWLYNAFAERTVDALLGRRKSGESGEKKSEDSQQ